MMGLELVQGLAWSWVIPAALLPEFDLYELNQSEIHHYGMSITIIN